MELIKPLILLVLFFGATKAVPRTSAVECLGVGYNLVDGNPEGDLSNANVDPGLKKTRRMLTLTYNTNRRTLNDRISLPDQAHFSPRLSCSTRVTRSSYYGAKSYQRQLQVGVSASASGSYGLFSFAFTASAKMKRIQGGSSSTTNINTEERRVCNRGTARYLLERAGIRNSHIGLQAGFVADIKRLPTHFNRFRYGRFLDKWGTHVVTEVLVGSIYTKTTSITRQEALQYAIKHNSVGLSVSGGYAGASGSVSVNVDRLTRDRSFSRQFNYKSHENARGSTITFRNGRWNIPNVAEFHEPIKITIKAIDKIMTTEFTSDAGVLRRRSNMIRALREYHIYKSLRRPTDNAVIFPVAWPKGRYGLVRHAHGCPSGSNSGFYTGERYHDTEDRNSNNQWSHTFSLWGSRARNNMKWGFCMKLSDGQGNVNYPWPAGRYCIFRYGSHCPHGFDSGQLRWDDEDRNNRNSRSGHLPDGRYDSNTIMSFCCRTDGDTNSRIILPTNRPFILMRSQNSNGCQQVFGMRVSQQFFRWDDEDSNNGNWKHGAHPYDDGGSRNHRLHFCVYQR